MTRGLGEDRIGDTPEPPPPPPQKRGGCYGLCMARMILHGNALFLEVNGKYSLSTDQLCQISLNAWDIVYTHQFPCASNSPLLQDKSTTIFFVGLAILYILTNKANIQQCSCQPSLITMKTEAYKSICCSLSRLSSPDKHTNHNNIQLNKRLLER